ncbi:MULTISPECIES: zinc-binding dehydrogenase [unclassified Crossiella]|uniref:zinc-binding dehydrogenase n=1 Tax=unclassified Crossiella TaxID=2620835 RepID=UPI001FFE802C|nr:MULTISPECIES: zinc-binding dehydrogenase [unclassified Crossiella]MCK2241414.1 zinc-binding dehydrogenase [Crossiella sp. S99.2]MCK2257032.1 zinc-binding dehydrogenase [Crossiella sp. S99.1]
MDKVMTAAVLTRHGGPDTLELRRDHPVPAPGAGQVLVRVTAAALNNTDIWTREGAYGRPGDPEARSGWRGPIAFPRVQGGDIAGVIAEVGPDLPADLIGGRVLVDPALYRDEGEHAPPVGLLGSEADGGFAEYVLARADRVHQVADSPLTDAELACLPVAYGTAMGMLERGGIGPGETVLVTGASGGVGAALVQLLAARGACPIAMTTAAKEHEVRALGATGLVTRDAGDLAGQIRVQAPHGLDAVADIAGGAAVNDLLPLIRDDGRWVIAGAVAGPTIHFDLRRLYLHNIGLIGSSMHTRPHFAKLVTAARAGAVRPPVAATFPLTAVHAAQRRFLERGHVGKIVLLPG